MEKGQKSESEALSKRNRIKSHIAGEGMFFFQHTREEKMDLFIWLCGCTLVCLLPSSVKAEEGGKFHMFVSR